MRRGSLTDGFGVRRPVQKLLSEVLMMSAPCLSWIRICDWTTVMMWLGPIAPWLLGINEEPSPNRPRKLAEAGGEEVGENALAEKELVVARLEVSEALLNTDGELDELKLKVLGLV